MASFLIIDPGHGGIDPGGGTNQLFKEKDLTLQISLYQYRRFRELNIPVVLTRTTDLTVTSDQRASIVKNSGAKYCISNHINSGGGRGAEAIYSNHSNATFAKTILDELEAEGMPARRVYTKTLPSNPQSDYYFMHRETGNVETIILEYGFADNNLDATFLQANWTKLAEATVRGFAEFANRPYQPPRPPNPGTNPPAPPDNWKREAVDWLFQEDLLTNEEWRTKYDQSLPLWAEAILLKRLYEKLSQNQAGQNSVEVIPFAKTDPSTNSSNTLLSYSSSTSQKPRPSLVQNESKSKETENQTLDSARHFRPWEDYV